MYNLLLDGGFSINTFMGNAQGFALMVVRYIIVILGIVAIGAGIFQIVKGFVSGGKGQVNWGMAVGCLLVGGALTAGGVAWVAKIAAGGMSEIDDAGTKSNAFQGGSAKGLKDTDLTINGVNYVIDFAD